MTNISWRRNFLPISLRFSSPLYFNIPLSPDYLDCIEITDKRLKDDDNSIQVQVIQRLSTVNSLWDACTCLIGYFTVNIKSLLEQIPKKHVRILEIGSGVGALSISLQKIIESQHLSLNKNVDIIITELQEEMDVLDENMNVNKIHQRNTSIQTKVLNWGSDEDVENILKEGEIDFVIASDVVYEIQHFDILIHTLNALCNRETVFIMAMEHRWSDIEGFWWDDMRRNGWEWTVVEKNSRYWWEQVNEIDIYIIKKKI